MSMPKKGRRAEIVGALRSDRAARADDRRSRFKSFEGEARASVERLRRPEAIYPKDTSTIVAEATSSPEAAKRYLRRLGIIDETGKLQPEYDRE